MVEEADAPGGGQEGRHADPGTRRWRSQAIDKEADVLVQVKKEADLPSDG